MKYGEFTELELNLFEDVDNIINHYDPKAIKMNKDSNGWSVLVTDKRGSGFDFWVDLWIDDYGDLNYDWNEYIFSTTNSRDMAKKMMQEYLYDDVMSEAEDFLYKKGEL